MLCASTSIGGGEPMQRIVLGLLVIVLAGCGPTYQVTKPDAVTGQLPTKVEVKQDEILVFTPSARMAAARFFVLRTGSGNLHTNPFGKFMLESLPELGIRPVMSRDEFVKMVLASELRDSVGNVTDPIALARISDAIGPFLIIDAAQVFQGHAWFETRVRVTDPSDASTLLDIHRLRTNWANLDKEVNFPILNVVKRWADESRALPPDAPPAVPARNI